MFNIQKYLEKVIKNINNNEVSVDNVINIIKEVSQIDLKKEDVELKAGVLYIKNKPAIKNKIFIYKSKIIDELNINSNQKVFDIK